MQAVTLNGNTYGVQDSNFIAFPRSAKQQTNNMEQNSSLEADSCQSIQEISSTLRNAKVHHTAQITPPKVHVMSQMNPIHALTYNSTLAYNLHLCLKWSLAFTHSHQNFSISPSHSCDTPRRTQSALFHYHNDIWSLVKIIKLVVMRNSPSFCHFPSHSGPNHSPHCSQIPLTFDILIYHTFCSSDRASLIST